MKRTPFDAIAGASVSRVGYDGGVIERTLTTTLEKRDDVVAAYLFGSRGRGDAGPRSDVDVAVLLRRAPRTFEEHPLELAGELEQALGVPVDVVVLNDAPSDLVHRVLRDGVLLLDRDRSARIAFEVRSRNDYFDMEPIRRAYRRGRPAP